MGQYTCYFPTDIIEKHFGKELSKISHKEIRERIMQAVEQLADNPRPFGSKPFRKLNLPIQCYQLTAQYRIRVGDYRILYDIDDSKKIVWILALRRRSEKTYE